MLDFFARRLCSLPDTLRLCPSPDRCLGPSPIARHHRSSLDAFARCLRPSLDTFGRHLMHSPNVRMEQMKMEMAREIESMRMEMEMEIKRTEMILESQQRIVEAFAKAVAEWKKKAKRMPTPKA